MRITIPAPDAYLFTTTYRVVINDINYGGHLGNDKYLTIAQEARIRFYEWLGFSEKNLGEEHIGTIMANSVVNYKAEAFHGDDLTIQIGVAVVGRSSFDLIYRISRDEQTIANILTTIVAFHLKEKNVKSIPQKFLQKLQTITS